MRKHSFRLAAVAAAVTGLALVGGGTALAANAAPAGVVIGNVYTDHLAGYATTSNGNTHMDDVRSTVGTPPQGETGAPIGTNKLIIGVEQQGSETAASFADGLGWEWDSTLVPLSSPNTGACPANQYELVYGDASGINPTLQVPQADLIAAQTYDPVLGMWNAVCSPDPFGSYLELQYIVSSHRLHFFAGSAWNDKVSFADVNVGYQPMLQAGVGITTTDGTAAASLQTGSVATFMSTRVTTRAGQNKALNYWNLNRFQGTEFNGPPSVINPLTLTTSGISGPTGPGASEYSVTAP